MRHGLFICAKWWYYGKCARTSQKVKKSSTELGEFRENVFSFPIQKKYENYSHFLCRNSSQDNIILSAHIVINSNITNDLDIKASWEDHYIHTTNTKNETPLSYSNIVTYPRQTFCYVPSISISRRFSNTGTQDSVSFLLNMLLQRRKTAS